MTAKLDLRASRNIAWEPTINLFYPGGPLPVSGATIIMEVRLYPGAPGAPLARASGIPFADIPAPPGGGKRCLQLTPVIPFSDLQTFPTGLNNPEPGEADVYSYDIIVSYADGSSDKLALGQFILEPGVTRA